MLECGLTVARVLFVRRRDGCSGGSGGILLSGLGVHFAWSFSFFLFPLVVFFQFVFLFSVVFLVFTLSLSCFFLFFSLSFLLSFLFSLFHFLFLFFLP